MFAVILDLSLARASVVSVGRLMEPPCFMSVSSEPRYRVTGTCWKVSSRRMPSSLFSSLSWPVSVVL